jgi:hypothetical protein
MATDNRESPSPRFTEKMTAHLNGGSKFSELHYRVYADGVETKITHGRRTDGSPRYLITSDVFSCGDETFDNLAARGVGLKEWLVAHLDANHREGER